MAEETVDPLFALQLENQQLRDRVRELTKWAFYLEASTKNLANGLAAGLQDWVSDLQRMSPLGPEDAPVDP